MAILGVDDFKSKLRGGGARPNLFKVTINYPGFANGDAELTSFLVEAASLPGSTFGTILVPFRGRILKIAGDRTFENWQTTILNDTDFNVRNAIERWMNGINAHSANTGLTTPIAYEADLKVDQLDRNGDVLKTYTFRGAYPTDLSDIALSYADNDTIERFNCTWSYQYFESDTTS
jgi:hypothetical protein